MPLRLAPCSAGKEDVTHNYNLDILLDLHFCYMHGSNVHLFKESGEGGVKQKIVRKGSLLVRQSKSPQTPSTIGRALRCGGVGGNPAKAAIISYGESAGVREPVDWRDVCRIAREAPTSIASLRAGDMGPLGGPFLYGERVGVHGPADGWGVCWIVRETPTSIVGLRAGDKGPLGVPIGTISYGVSERFGVCGPADGRDVCWIAREAPTSIVSVRAGDGGPLGGLFLYGGCVGVCGPADGWDVCWIAREMSTSIVGLRAGDKGPLGGPIDTISYGECIGVCGRPADGRGVCWIA
jgi:hypothetical protein